MFCLVNYRRPHTLTQSVFVLVILLCCCLMCVEANGFIRRRVVVAAVVVAQETQEQRLVVEALRELHKLLDDDKSGGIDSSESKDFLRMELQSEDDNKEKYFHANDGDDLSISVDDLFRAWMSNSVRNWTNSEMVTWLQDVVQLPQYVQAFVENNITGDMMPVLAVQSVHFMQKVLGIVSIQHRKKLELRATDVVLFGPVSLGNGGSLLKDVVVLVSLTLTTFLMYYAYKVRKRAQHQLAKMMVDVESLKQAERELKSLQERVGGTNEVDFGSYEKDVLAATQEEQQEEIQRLRFAEEELEEVRAALLEAHNELAQRNQTISSELRHLLHLTYEREKKYYDAMKKQALKEMEAAKDEFERINRKRSSLLGSLRLAHGSHFTNIDGRIAEARASLIMVTNDLQEQQLRWKQIEILCGQKLNSSLVSPVNLEPVQEHEIMSTAGEKARNGLISSMFAGSGCDSVSVCSLPTRSNIPVTDGDGIIRAGPIWSKNRSNSETGTSTSTTARQRKLLGDKREQMVSIPFISTDEKQATGSISSNSSSGSLGSVSAVLPKGFESSQQRQQRIVPLVVTGRQSSDPSLKAFNEQNDLLNFYQNKDSYVPDYNSLACGVVPRPEREPADPFGSRSDSNSLDVGDEGLGGNVSDSEVLNHGDKKKRKRFWSRKETKNPNL